MVAVEEKEEEVYFVRKSACCSEYRTANDSLKERVFELKRENRHLKQSSEHILLDWNISVESLINERDHILNKLGG